MNEDAFDYVPADSGVPPLYAQDGKRDEAIVYLKWFLPVGGATWYVTEYDPTGRIAFGWVTLGDEQNAELGYISLDEIESIAVMNGHIRVERDVWWTPTRLGDVKSGKVR